MPSAIPARNTSTIRRFIAYARPYVWLLVLATFCGIVRQLIPMVWPHLMKEIINLCLYNPELTPDQKWEFVMHRLLIAGLLLAFFPIPAYLRRFWSGKIAGMVVLDLRRDLYAHIQRMSHSFFDRMKSGTIVSRIMSDIHLAQNFMGNAMSQVWVTIISLVFVVVYLIHLNWVLALISLSLVPLFMLNLKVLGQRVKVNAIEIQDQVAELSGDLQEKISGMATVKAFTGEKGERVQFDNGTRGIFESSLSNYRLAALNEVISGLIVGASPIIVGGVSSYMVIKGKMGVGDLFAFYVYLGSLYAPLTQLSNLNLVYNNALAAMERVFEVFDIMPDVTQKPDAVPFKNAKGAVHLDDVYFSYGRGQDALRGITLDVQPGEMIAIVGPSGSGKSTLVNLLPRFYDVTGGAIRMDGLDIRDVKLKHLRSQVGMVLQEPILFSGTVGENIMYGRTDATHAEMKAAARAANAHEFIADLPDGYDTLIGERGARLSLGQRQRIAIARVFLKNPAILILDEATSALDSESENLVQDAFTRLMRDRTSFVIAHRLSTIVDADRIVVIQRGEIAEIGKHAELLAQNGVYANLYTEQFRSVASLLPDAPPVDGDGTDDL